MTKRFLTIDDLYQFCKTNKMYEFSSKSAGGPIILQSFEEVTSGDTSKDGLFPVFIKACHIGLNRNKSYISDDSMQAASESFMVRPILANVIQLDDGSYDFHSHDMEIIRDTNGDSQIKFIEIPVGVTDSTSKPTLEYDKEKDKTYLMSSGYIFEDYSMAAEIMRRKKTTKCSVEIAVEELSYNVEEDCLSIDKFHFTGITLLGSEKDGTTIEEGMEGSKISIEDFSAKNNSYFGADYQNKMIEILDKLNMTLSDFNNSKEKEDENMTKFDELLAKYEKTKEDVDFEIEGLSDEELETKFEEVFGCKTKKKCSKEHFDELLAKYNTTAEDCDIAYEDVDEDDVDAAFKAKFEDDTDDDNDDDDDDDDDIVIDDDDEDGKKKAEKYTLTYELSHDDIRSGLYNLYNALENYNMWIIEVFDTYFIVQDFCESNYYKQGYIKTEDSVAFDGEPIEVYNEWLTQSEKDALTKLKSDYEILKDFKSNYDAAEVKAQKDAIFADVNYECLAEEESFKALINDAEKFSAEEIRTKCDLIFAAHIKSVGSFAQKTDDTKPNKVGFNLNVEPSEEYAPYGNILPPVKKTTK